MKSADKTAFLAVMKELDYGVNEKKLSCWPGYGYGGAMGVAQFMPSTWNGYKSRIASMTGHNPPNPWSITDGVVGMAIKLANAGATKKSGEKNAAKIYYCGGPSSPYWKTKCEDYAKKVLYWADNYEQKLDN
jgi:membrane-bound lytic murein transglycosylase B